MSRLGRYLQEAMWFRHPVTVLCSGLVLYACGGDEASVPAGGSSDVGVTDTSGGGDAVVLPPCVDATDCRGGELCFEGECREACDVADPCRGALPVCDPVSRVCVGCLSSSDCGAGSRCVEGTCESFCTLAVDCAAGEACDTRTGQCVAAQCTDDAQCAGGQACREGLCRPIEEPICAPGETRCDGNTLQTCANDGARYLDATCEDRCVQSADGASCVTEICEPNEIGCLNATTAFLCDRTGTSRESLPCGDGQSCVEGTCRVQTCEPGSFTCDGDTVLACDETGTAQVGLACSATPECADAEFGCGCADGVCEVRICDPGASACVGPGYRTCREDGLGFLPVVTCESGTSCIAGACLANTCSSGAQSCSGDTLLTCTSTGTGYLERDCAAESSTCVSTGASTAQCRSRVCEPRSTRCSADQRSVVTCDEQGLTEATAACPAGDYCSGGVCVDQVCTPNATVCATGDVYRCNAAGSAQTLVDECASNEVCAAGACIEDTSECSSSVDCPRPASLCDGNTLVSYSANGRCSAGSCDYSTVVTRTNCSTTSRVCDAATSACITPPTTGDCTSDEQCRSRAAAAGYTGSSNRVQCDPEVGCYLTGTCPGTDGTTGTPSASDPFQATCSEATTCNVIFDLFGGGTDTYACYGCTVGDDSACRDGEVCRQPPFDLLGLGPFCATPTSGGGLPFP